MALEAGTLACAPTSLVSDTCGYNNIRCDTYCTFGTGEPLATLLHWFDLQRLVALIESIHNNRTADDSVWASS